MSHVTTTFNNDGRIGTATVDGVTYSYNYVDIDGGATRVTTITDPTGGAQRFELDTVAEVVKAKSVTVNGQTLTTRYDYDGSGRVTNTTFPEGNSISYTYDGRGNIVQTTATPKPGSGLPAIITSAGYDASCTNTKTCNKPVWTKDALGNQTDYTYDGTHGGLLTVTGAAGANGVRPQARYGYKGLKAYSKTSTSAAPSESQPIYLATSVSTCRTSSACSGGADETLTTTSYGPQSAGTGNNLLPASQTVSAGDGSLSATSAYSFDSIGNLVAVDGPLPGTGDVANFTYSAARELLSAVTPDPDGTGPLKRRASVNHYADIGLRDSVVQGTTDANGGSFEAQRQMVASYDGNRRIVRKTILSGGTTYGVTGYSYDGAGRLVCTAVRMDQSQWSGQTDNCTPQTTGSNGPDRVTKLGYDAIGRVVSVVKAFGTAEAAREQQSYTANGQVASVTDGNGNITSYGYDGFDRTRTTTYPGGSYEQLGYDANGNVKSRRLRDGQVLSYDFDALNLRTNDHNPGTNVAEVSVDYTYDNLGRLLRAYDGNGWTKTFAYDALGRATQQGSNIANTALLYDAAGRMTRQTWSDGFYVTYEYDVAGEMTAIRENGGLALATFAYDNLGRRTNLTRGNGTVTTYGYDAVSRLTSLNQDLAGTARDQSYTFTYNTAGQIVSRTASNDAYAWTGALNVDRSYAVNGLNQYTSAGGTSFSYDGRGNLTNSGGTTYQYNSRNQLFMNAAGQLIYRNPAGELGQTPGTNYDWVNGQLAQESGNSIQRRYVYGPRADEVLVWYEGAGTSDRRYLHADERGSVVAVSDNTGNAIAVNSYDEYGIPGASNQGRFQYTGQAWLPEIGMYDYKARMYSPSLGRFMQTDPVGYGDGLNWYNYTGGDPVNSKDPTGSLVERNLYIKPVNPNEPRPDGNGGYFGDEFSVTANQMAPNASPSIRGVADFSSHSEMEGGGGISPQKTNDCPKTSSVYASIADGASTVGDYADGVAIGAAGLGIATAPTGVGGAFFGGTAIVAGLVGKGASLVETGAHLLDGNYTAAGASALGIIGGEAVGRIAGGVAGRFMSRNRMFGDLSAGQLRRADLYKDSAGAAGTRIASRVICK